MYVTSIHNDIVAKTLQISKEWLKLFMILIMHKLNIFIYDGSIKFPEVMK